LVFFRIALSKRRGEKKKKEKKIDLPECVTQPHMQALGVILKKRRQVYEIISKRGSHCVALLASGLSETSAAFQNGRDNFLYRSTSALLFFGSA